MAGSLNWRTLFAAVGPYCLPALLTIIPAMPAIAMDEEMPIHNLTSDQWYATIQEAVDYAANGDELVLSPGTYTGDGNRDVDILGTSLTLRSVDPDNPFTVASTVIDCEGDGFNRHRAFRLESTVPFCVTLAGLTIRNGSAPVELVDDEIAAAGGAVYSIGAALTLDACVLDNNGALARKNNETFRMRAHGGAVYHVGPNLTITRCVLTENKATPGPPEHPYAQNSGWMYGGAIRAVVTNSMVIEDSLLAHNYAGGSYPTGYAFGGAIYCTGPAAIRRCTISANQTISSNDPSHGGGVVGGGEMIDCTIIDNSAGSGNAIPSKGGGVAGAQTIRNCLILRNHAAQGGGVYSAGVISNSIIAHNSAAGEGPQFGGGATGATLVQNCLVVANFAYSDGGGLDNVTQVRNCTILANRSGSNGSGLYECDAVSNCIIRHNYEHSYLLSQIAACPDITYCTIEGWRSGGDGNMADDPRFRVTDAGALTAPPECAYTLDTCRETMLTDDTKTWASDSLVGKWLHIGSSPQSVYFIRANTATTLTVSGNLLTSGVGDPYQIDDYRLQSCSPCVDAGDPAGDYLDQTDIDGEPRVILSNVDIGADEFNPATLGPVPGTPADAVAVPASVCPGGCAMLTANFCDGGDELEWFADAPDGTQVPGGSVPQVCPEFTTTYFVRARNTGGGQVSAYTSTTLTVRQPGLWQPVNPGFDGKVSALIGYDGEMVAGGYFSNVGQTPAVGVAAWDGSQWRELGGGMEYPEVSALAVYNGELIAAGVFGSAGGVVAWDGSAWRSLGDGNGPWPAALAVYDGELIAGGTMVPVSTIASRWDGQAWFPLAASFDGACKALAVYRGELIAGGSFTELDGVSVNRVARWNGLNWNSLGAGMDDDVHNLVVHDDKLIAVGSFSMAGGVPANRVAAWNGSAWTAMDNGITVSRVAAYRNELVALGTVEESGGSIPVTAHWTGSAWQVVSSAPEGVSMLTEYDGELYAGGTFTGGLMSWGCWPVRLVGDFDGDLDVDTDDLQVLEACSWGPAVSYAEAGIAPECTLEPDMAGLLAADFDSDGDIDADDFAQFQRCRADEIEAVNPECKRTLY